MCFVNQMLRRSRQQRQTKRSTWCQKQPHLRLSESGPQSVNAAQLTVTCPKCPRLHTTSSKHTLCHRTPCLLHTDATVNGPIVCLFLELQMNAALLPANCVTLLWSRLMYRCLCRASLIYQCWFDGCTLLWLNPVPAVCFRLQAFTNKLGLLLHCHCHT